MSPSSYKIEVLPGESIVTAKMFSNFNFQQEADSLLAELQTAFDSVEGPFFYVGLIEDINVNFGDVVSALAMVTRGKLAVVRHPDMKKMYIAASSNLITMGTKALGQTQYGGIKAEIVKTFDAGLEKARSEQDLLTSS